MESRVPKKLIKQILDHNFMRDFFNSRIKRYFPKAREVERVEINIRKNFLKYESLSLEYKLKIKYNFTSREKTIQGRFKRTKNCLFDNPRNHYLFLNYLWQNGFKRYLVKPLDYLADYNLLLYENVSGISFQNLLENKKTKIILDFIPLMARLLFKIHCLPIKKKDQFPLKTKNIESTEVRHWLHLLKNFYPSGISPIKRVLKKLDQIKRNYPFLFGKINEYRICHGDIHLGNFLKSGEKIKIIDFGEAYLYDSFDDVGRFLIQLESMSLFYLGKDYQGFYQKAVNLFIKNYFKKEKISKKEKIKIKYFELRNLIQITANLIFLQKSDKLKRKIIRKFNFVSQRILKEIKSLKNDEKKIY